MVFGHPPSNGQDCAEGSINDFAHHSHSFKGLSCFLSLFYCSDDDSQDDFISGQETKKRGVGHSCHATSRILLLRGVHSTLVGPYMLDAIILLT